MFQIKVAQWNCFKLTTVRIIELKNFLNIIKPDIISIQELKLGEE
jgi:exonuclease III